MRTDGVQLAPEAIGQTRRLIETKYGQSYLPEKPRVYTSKAKNAQEAHEAIRPTDLFRTPQDVARLSRQGPARPLRADLEAHRGQPDGKRRARPGHGRHRQRRQDRAAARHRLGREVRRLPHALRRGPGRRRQRGRGRQRHPARRRARARRWTAARSCRSSISPSRRRAIPKRAWSRSWRSSASAGPRPMPASSRCCSDRNYVKLDRKRFIPEDRGRLVTAFLQTYFPRYVEYNFTAHLEEELDDISGRQDRLAPGAARLLEGLLGRRRRDQGPARQAKCSTSSTRSSARTSSRPTTTAARARATARPAPTAGSA